MNQNFKFNVLAFLTVCIWGITFVSTKILLSDGFTPTWIFIIRFAIAYVCVFALSHNKLWANTKKDELYMLAMGLTGGSVYFILENNALQLTYASNVSLIICTAPILTIILDSIVNKTKVKFRVILGSLIALCGVAIVVLNGSITFGLNPLGDILTFLAALSFASYCIILKDMSKRYSNLFITRKVFFYEWVSALIYGFTEPFPQLISLNVFPQVLINMLFLSIIASFLCFLVWNKAVQVLGPNTTSNYIYFTPMITIIASTLILKEPITAWLVVGGIVIITGVYMSTK